MAGDSTGDAAPTGAIDPAEDPRAALASVLLEVGAASRGPGDVSTRLTAICTAMTTVLGCDRSSIFLRDGDRMLPVANHGNPPHVERAFRASRFRASSPIFERILTAERPIHIPDAPGAVAWLSRSVVSTASIRSMIVARIPGSDRPAGVITAEFNETNDSFAEFDTVVVDGLAHLASLVVDEEATRARETALLAEIQWRSDHDELTDLPNRRALARWFDDAAQSLPDDALVAVLLADLDRFKVVNDALGHAAGDRLLVAVADRFGSAFDDSDVLVSRFGGDEFVITAVVDDQEHAERIADALAVTLVEPISLSEEHEVVVTASVGIAITSVATLEPDLLLSDADAAMYIAKEERRGHSVLALSDQRPIVTHRFALEVSLASAIDDNEIRPWYQPIIDMTTGRCVAVEALARWVRPDRSVALPASFFASVTEMGLLRRLTDCILGQAAADFATYPLGGIDLFVNLSVSDIDDDLADRLVGFFHDCSGLVIELTERDAMQHSIDVQHVLSDIRALGVKVALDDFGTGYSSLSLLAELPLDIVKIDRSLIAGVVEPRAAETVRATVRLGTTLGLTMLAEGVEEQAELDGLVDSTIDLVQGFLLARPMSATDLVAAFERGDLRR